LIDTVTCSYCRDDCFLEYQIAGKTWSVINEVYRHADQEKASDAPSSYPGQSRVVGIFDRTHYNSATEKTEYEHVAILTLIGWARGMVKRVGFVGASEPVEQDEIVISPDHEHAYPALPARIYDGKLPTLRPSVSIIPHSQDKHDFDVTRFGGTFEEPDVPSPDSLGAVQLGPMIVKPTPALKDCAENTIAGVHRHYQALPLEPMGQAANATVDDLNQILSKYLQYGASEDPGLHMASIKLPLKWSKDLQDSMWEFVERDYPQIYTAMQKLRELGLDFNKLPRLVLNMGQKAAASNALFCCPTESVMHHCFTHTTLKHKTLEEVDTRIEEFHENFERSRTIVLQGQVIYKTKISTDNSKMDSTVFHGDRMRYVTCVRALLAKLRDGIRTMRDPIAGLGKIDTNRKIFIANKFISLAISAADMGLGSGERMTTGCNRHTKMLNQGFELVHELGKELGVLVFRLWLLYEPGEHRDLTQSEINQIRNGKFLRHHDSAYDLGMGDGDDNLSIFCSLEPLIPGQASERLVSIHKKCYKIIEPAFATEFQHASEVLSRVHIPKLGIHFPLPKKFLQKIVLGHLDCEYDRVSQTVRLEGANYAQVATALLQRVYAARQLPLLRWLALALAEYYAYLARSMGWETSVYTDDDRRKGLEDGDYVILAMCNNMRDWLHGGQVDFHEITIVLADGRPVHPDTPKELAYADLLWSEMHITKDMILHRDYFEKIYPLSGDVRSLLGIDAWTELDSFDKLVKSVGDSPSPSGGNATSLAPPRRVRTQQSRPGQPGTALEVGVAKPTDAVGWGVGTVTDVESVPADTCQDGADSMRRGICTNTAVVATVSPVAAHNGGLSGATAVCGSGVPGPPEPEEVQPRAQTVLLSEVLPASSSTDARNCQVPITIPLVMSAGGVVKVTGENPQLSPPEAALDSTSKPVPCVRTVEPGSDVKQWHDTVLQHLMKYGLKDVDQMIVEGILPVYKKGNASVAQEPSKRRLFANRVMQSLSKTGTVAQIQAGSSQVPKWFAVAKPPGL